MSDPIQKQDGVLTTCGIPKKYGAGEHADHCENKSGQN